jgi:peptidoglycan/LPS O-acetylase OafA/YrhL
MNPKKEIFPSINGLRALSIILVILHHLSLKDQIFLPILEEYPWSRPVIDILQDGQFGVNIFFVISGFLITTVMLSEEVATGTLSFKKFFARRMLRIFPAYYFLLFVYFILQNLGYIHLTLLSWITALTYTKDFIWISFDWYTAHSWSLSVEEHFYLFWPLVFVYGKSFRKEFAIFLIIIVPFFRVIDHFYQLYWIHDQNIFTRIDAISTGVVFALYRKQILNFIKNKWQLVFYVFSFILLTIRVLPAWANKIQMEAIFIPLGVSFGTIANFAIAFFMMYVVFGPQKILHRVLNTKFLNFIGLLSYSLYLWQQIFIAGSDHWIGKYPVNILFLSLTALFSYYIIEKPFLKIKSDNFS